MLLLLTGIPASGKSTVAQGVAEALPRSAHVRGDLFRRMVVGGREEMGAAEPSAEALTQLALRYELAVEVADRYAAAGFDVVLQVVVLGEHVARVVERVRTRPFSVVVLAPSAAAVSARDAARQEARAKVAYRAGDLDVTATHRLLHEDTPRVGWWCDSSDLSVEQTVAAVLSELDGAAASRAERPVALAR